MPVVHGNNVPFVRLVVEIWSDSSTTHGPSVLQGIVWDAAKVGWSWYSRFPSNAFFSLRQSSTHNADIVPGLDHLRVYYMQGIDNRAVYKARSWQDTRWKRNPNTSY